MNTGMYADPNLDSAVKEISAKAQAGLLQSVLGFGGAKGGRIANPLTIFRHSTASPNFFLENNQ
jgi:hypothetical protein